MRTQSKDKPHARNAGDQVVIGFSFAFDWLREWREFPGPIKEESRAKPMQSRISFETQLKIALNEMSCVDHITKMHVGVILRRNFYQK